MRNFFQSCNKNIAIFRKMSTFVQKNTQNYTLMKRFTITLASLLMLFLVKANAQNQRVILLESFTNTGCGPCAQYNPGMDALIANNADKIAAIKYHVNWPSGSDPMYLHNTTENGARTSYCSINSVPHVVIDGNRINTNPASLTQANINQVAAIESPMEMRLAYEVDAAANTITVHVMGRASSDIASCKLYVAVIENEIHFNSAPGPNGERDFYSVMKKMLPDASGTLLGTLAANDYFTYTFSWDLANIYNMDQLDAIAWVQNTSTKEVYQACKSSQTFVPFYANEASASDISNMKSVNCSGLAHPEFVLTNNGSNTLTSAALEVVLNGETVKTMTWTGNLTTLASEVVELGEISFPIEEENLLEVRIASINGGDDDIPDNNIATYDFEGAPDIVGKELKLTIRTDSNPEETTWRVTNLATGEVILEGGPYDTPNHKYDEILTVTEDGCFDFTIFDAGGNGFSGSGVYGLRAGNSTLFSGKRFGYSESNEFSYEVVDGTVEIHSITTSIYPNPTSGVINIVSKGEQAVNIYNLVGQRIFEGVSNGYLQIDMKAYGTGIYAIQVGDETRRIVVK